MKQQGARQAWRKLPDLNIIIWILCTVHVCVAVLGLISPISLNIFKLVSSVERRHKSCVHLFLGRSVLFISHVCCAPELCPDQLCAAIWRNVCRCNFPCSGMSLVSVMDIRCLCCPCRESYSSAIMLRSLKH